MADPITWRTVVGNGLENAWRPMSGAVSSFDSGIDRLMKVIEGRQEANQGVADRAREANVQSYLDRLAGAKTPEELAALQAAGELDPLRAAIDPRDAARVRGADEARLASLRQQLTATRKFGDENTEYSSRGAVNDVFAQAVASKDPAVISNLIQTLPADHPRRAELAKELNSLVLGNAKTGSDLESADVTRKTALSNAAATTSQAATAARREETYSKEVGLKAQEALEKRLTDVSTKLSTMQGGLTSQAAQQEIDNFIKTLPKEDQSRMQDAIGRLAANPKYAGMSPEAAIMAARGDVSLGGPIRKYFWNGTGDSIEAQADKILASPGYVATQGARAEAIKTLQTQRDVLRASLYPKVTTPGAPVPDDGEGGDDPALNAGEPSKDPNGAARVQAALAQAAGLDPEKPLPMALRNPPPVTAAAGGASATPDLPAPTQRFNNPPDSVAGKFERRVFAEQQAQEASKAQQVKVQLQEAAQAQTVANELLAKGDARALSKFQTTPAFSLLDRDTKAKIFAAVNR